MLSHDHDQCQSLGLIFFSHKVRLQGGDEETFGLRNLRAAKHRFESYQKPTGRGVRA